MGLREDGLNPAVCGALSEPQILLKKDREADRRDQRRLRGHVAQRPEHQPLGHQAVRRPDHRRQSEHGEQAERQRAGPAQGEHGDADEARVGADHRDLAEGEVDLADDAIDQRVADRDQTIEAAEGERFDGELESVEEIAPAAERGAARGALAPARLLLVPAKPVLPQKEDLNIGQLAGAIADDADQLQAIAIEAAPAEAAGEPVHPGRGVRPGHPIADDHRVRGRVVDLAAFDRDAGVGALDARKHALAEPCLLDVEGAAGAELKQEGEARASDQPPSGSQGGASGAPDPGERQGPYWKYPLVSAGHPCARPPLSAHKIARFTPGPRAGADGAYPASALCLPQPTAASGAVPGTSRPAPGLAGPDRPGRGAWPVPPTSLADAQCNSPLRWSMRP